MVAEAGPLTGVVAGYGPPVLALAGPWLLVVLALAGPFAVVFTFAAVLVAVALIVLVAGTILTSPYLLFRHLRRRRAAHVPMSRPAVRIAPMKTPRAAS
jgi:hypothetical protein